MAHLSGPGSPAGERAQLLLVGAFILAVIFVALALVVNSAIYTENLATRGVVPGSNAALEQRHEVEQGVGATIEYVNEYNYTSLGDIEENVENISHDHNRQQILLSRTVNVSYVGKVDGHRIAQQNDSDRGFTNDTGHSDWVLASGVDRTRAFTIDVTDPSELSGPFTVVANDTSSSNTWEMTVDGTASSMTVDVENGNGATATCDRTITTSNATIDVTGGLVAGQPCAALAKLTGSGDDMSFGSGLSGSYDIEFENGDDIAGNYSLVIGSKSANGNSLDDSRSDTPPSSEAPYYTNAIYSVTVEYAFRTPDVTYETEIVVAPGEPQ